MLRTIWNTQARTRMRTRVHTHTHTPTMLQPVCGLEDLLDLGFGPNDQWLSNIKIVLAMVVKGQVNLQIVTELIRKRGETKWVLKKNGEASVKPGYIQRLSQIIFIQQKLNSNSRLTRVTLSRSNGAAQQASRLKYLWYWGKIFKFNILAVQQFLYLRKWSLVPTWFQTQGQSGC